MPATARGMAERQGVSLSERGREAEERRALADHKPTSRGAPPPGSCARK
jgi:hypothetical protein